MLNRLRCCCATLTWFVQIYWIYRKMCFPSNLFIRISGGPTAQTAAHVCVWLWILEHKNKHESVLTLNSYTCDCFFNKRKKKKSHNIFYCSSRCFVGLNLLLNNLLLAFPSCHWSCCEFSKCPKVIHLLKERPSSIERAEELLLLLNQISSWL